jgi:hypothetical protein
MFESLPGIVKVWFFLWSYLAVSGWFSTYMLIRQIGGTRRNDMVYTIIPADVFVWTVMLMIISSVTVIGLFFYGRYARKKKDVAKAALKKYEETKVYVDPKLKFDPAVMIFWIGGSVLNVLFSLMMFFAVINYTDLVLEPPIMYALMGLCISFFSSVLIYVITQFMANGILDAKAVRSIIKTIVGCDETKKAIGIVCKKFGILDAETVEKVYGRVKDHIIVAEYNELTPDEILTISKVIEEHRTSGENKSEGNKIAEGTKAVEKASGGSRAADGGRKTERVAENKRVGAKTSDENGGQAGKGAF